MNHKKLLHEINQLVWGGKWEGEIDPGALVERIEELLACEESLSLVQKDLEAFRESFRKILNDDKDDGSWF